MSEQKIAKTVQLCQIYETTNVVNLHRMALIFFESSRTAALVLGGVTLPPAISSLVNRMLSRAKARESGFLLPTTLSSRVFRSSPAIQTFLPS